MSMYDDGSHIRGRKTSSGCPFSSATATMEPFAWSNITAEEKERLPRAIACQVFYNFEKWALKDLVEEALNECAEETVGEFGMDDIFDFDLSDEPQVRPPADDVEECEVLPPALEHEEQDDDQIIPPPTQEDIDREERAHRTYVEERRNKNTVRKTASVSRK